MNDGVRAADFRGGRRCVVVIRGRRHPATGQVFPDMEAAPALRRVIAREDERMLGLRISADADPTDAELNGARIVIRGALFDDEP